MGQNGLHGHNWAFGSSGGQSVAALRAESAQAGRREEWYSVQIAQVLRIILRDVREQRAAAICAALNDGPISMTTLEVLLRESAKDLPSLEIVVPAGRAYRGN